MKIVRDSKGFTTVFNEKTGFYVRGMDVSYDPFMADFPHLIDVGVMGHCVHGQKGLCIDAGIECYQNGLGKCMSNMSIKDFKSIVDEGKDKLFEIALGGRGDVDQHENFEEILSYSVDNKIVPNFTTSGLGMTVEKAKICKKYCGAVAVSMYSRLNLIPRVVEVDGDSNEVFFSLGEDSYISSDKETGQVVYDEVYRGENYTLKAINTLISEGVKTNIHYVLSNSTIDEALLRLKYNGFPKGINAVVFLLHKPVGLGKQGGVLVYSDPKVQEFFKLVNEGNFEFKVGFDSCSIPGVLNMCDNIDSVSMDTCEGGRYSMYIDAQMYAVPCSFDNQDKKFAVKLGSGVSIKDAWESEQFDKFRNSLKNSCSGCSNRELCMGGCPLQPSIVLCDKPEKAQINV